MLPEKDRQSTVVDRVLKSSAEDLRRKLRRSGAIDGGVNGRYLASHAEKQVSITNPNKPIGVSRAMCLDCKDHFREVAHYSKKQQVVADPKVTRVFHPNRQIDVLPNHIDTENLSKYAKEAATRPLKDKGSLSKAVVNGLENSHLQRAFRVAAPVALGLDAVNLYNVYQKDGLGQEFRRTAGSVAGGWGAAAGGAAIGMAVGGPAGALVGGIIGGVVGSEFGDDLEQGAEKAGEAIAEGAKKAWNKLFG